MRLKLLKKRHHKVKYVEAQKQLKALTSTVKAAVDSNNAPFYWSVAKKNIDNIEYFDNSDDDMKTLVKEDETSANTEYEMQTKGPDVNDETNGNKETDDDTEVSDESAENIAAPNESDIRQFEEDVSDGSLEFSSYVQKWYPNTINNINN